MEAALFVDCLESNGVTFFTGVPDSYLHGFCSELAKRYQPSENVITANEGNAIGVAVGHYLATGQVPLVYMQNSGLGNAVNPLASLANREMLGIPMILLIGWRGDPYHSDHVQHHLQGRSTTLMLDALEIPYDELSADGDENLRKAASVVSRAVETQSPVALLAPKGILNGVKTPPIDDSYPLSREEAIRVVLDTMPADTIYSATTGRAARELFHVRNSRGEGHANDYLNVGSMGHASSVALGMALAHPDRSVVCLDGDAACLMHMGALAIPANLDVPGFIHVVLNNGHHESVGGQPSVAQIVDLTSVAAACGFETVGYPVSEPQEIAAALKDLASRKKAGFLDIRIHCGIRSDMPGLEIEPKEMKKSLMAAL